MGAGSSQDATSAIWVCPSAHCIASVLRLHELSCRLTPLETLANVAVRAHWQPGSPAFSRGWIGGDRGGEGGTFILGSFPDLMLKRKQVAGGACLSDSPSRAAVT